MTIERYLKMRNEGKGLVEIQQKNSLSEGTIWTLELGYQCYLKKISHDKAIKIIRSI